MFYERVLKSQTWMKMAPRGVRVGSANRPSCRLPRSTPSSRRVALVASRVRRWCSARPVKRRRKTPTNANRPAKECQPCSTCRRRGRDRSERAFETALGRELEKKKTSWLGWKKKGTEPFPERSRPLRVGVSLRGSSNKTDEKKKSTFLTIPPLKRKERERERHSTPNGVSWLWIVLNRVCIVSLVSSSASCVCVFFPQWDGHWKRTTRMLSMWKTSISNIRRAFGGLLPGTRNPIWLFFGFTRLWLSSQLNCYRFLLCFTWWLMMVSFMVWVAPLKRQKKKETKTFRPKTLMFDSDRGIRCARFAAFENDQTQWEPWYSILTSCGRPFFFDFLDWVRCSSFKNSPTTHRALIFDSNQLLWSTFCSDLISNNLVFLSIFVCSDSVSLWVVGFWVVFFLLCVVVVGHVFISRIGSSFYSRRKKNLSRFRGFAIQFQWASSGFFFSNPISLFSLIPQVLFFSFSFSI